MDIYALFLFSTDDSVTKLFVTKHRSPYFSGSHNIYLNDWKIEGKFFLELFKLSLSFPLRSQPSLHPPDNALC